MQRRVVPRCYLGKLYRGRDGKRVRQHADAHDRVTTLSEDSTYCDVGHVVRLHAMRPNVFESLTLAQDSPRALWEDYLVPADKRRAEECPHIQKCDRKARRGYASLNYALVRAIPAKASRVRTATQPLRARHWSFPARTTRQRTGLGNNVISPSSPSTEQRHRQPSKCMGTRRTTHPRRRSASQSPGCDCSRLASASECFDSYADVGQRA